MHFFSFSVSSLSVELELRIQYLNFNMLQNLFASLHLNLQTLWYFGRPHSSSPPPLPSRRAAVPLLSPCPINDVDAFAPPNPPGPSLTPPHDGCCEHRGGGLTLQRQVSSFCIYILDTRQFLCWLFDGHEGRNIHWLMFRCLPTPPPRTQRHPLLLAWGKRFQSMKYD